MKNTQDIVLRFKSFDGQYRYDKMVTGYGVNDTFMNFPEFLIEKFEREYNMKCYCIVLKDDDLKTIDEYPY